jgi:ribosomal-protein-alanine N-acetyltransferase
VFSGIRDGRLGRFTVHRPLFNCSTVQLFTGRNDNDMDQILRPMTPKDADEIVAWRYPVEYAFYNMDADPEDLVEFLDVDKCEPGTKFVMADDDGAALGFFEFTTRDGVTDIGLGLRPDLTGRGLGADFLRAGLAFAVERFQPRTLRLAVAAFNRRAITVYERVGFAITKAFMQTTNGGVYEFVEMEAAPSNLRLLPGDRSR